MIYLFALFVLIVITGCVYVQRKDSRPDRRRSQCCDYLDELHGGAWYYNGRTNHYEDA